MPVVYFILVESRITADEIVDLETHHPHRDASLSHLSATPCTGAYIDNSRARFGALEQREEDFGGDRGPEHVH